MHLLSTKRILLLYMITQALELDTVELVFVSLSWCAVDWRSTERRLAILSQLEYIVIAAVHA